MRALNINVSKIKVINTVLIILLLLVCWRIMVTILMPDPILNTHRRAEVSNNLATGLWQWFDNAAVTQKRLNKARLNAEVLGVVVRGDQSVVLLSLPGRPEGVYRVGDKVNNQTEVEAIEAHRIVLRENGVLRELELETLGDSPTSSVVRHTNNSSNDDAMAILNMARAVPVSVEGVTGLRLDDLSQEIQQLSELKSGDIVLSVEGQNIQSLQSGNNWQSLMNKTDAQVSLMRDGQQMIIQVNVATLAQQMMQSLTK